MGIGCRDGLARKGAPWIGSDPRLTGSLTNQACIGPGEP